VRHANGDTTSRRWKVQGIEHDRQLGRNLIERTVSGGAAGLLKGMEEKTDRKKSAN